MKEQDELGTDRSRSGYLGEELPTKNLAAEEGGGGRSVLPMSVNLGCPGRFSARALLSLFVLLLLAVVMLAAPVASPRASR